MKSIVTLLFTSPPRRGALALDAVLLEPPPKPPKKLSKMSLTSLKPPNPPKPPAPAPAPPPVIRVYAGMTELVVPCTFLGVRQHFVRFVDFLEFFCCFFIVRDAGQGDISVPWS